MTKIDWMIARLGEKSTWLGLLTLLGALGLQLTPEISQNIISSGLALVGLIGAVTKEKGSFK